MCFFILLTVHTRVYTVCIETNYALFIYSMIYSKKYKYFMKTDLEKAAFYLIFHMLTFQISSAEMNSYYLSLKCLSELPA